MPKHNIERPHRITVHLSEPERHGLHILQGQVWSRNVSDAIRFLIAIQLQALGFPVEAAKIINEEEN